MEETLADTQKFLDNLTGVPTLLSLIEGRYVVKESGKGLSKNDFTDELKAKLEKLNEDAVKNQNAFSNVKVGSDTIAAGTETDTFEIAAGNTNVTIAADTTSKKVTISTKDTTYTTADGDNDGLMSKGDFTKLAGMTAGAEPNKIEVVKRNGTALSITAADKSVDITVPEKTSDLTNDSTWQTKAEIDAAIKTAVDTAVSSVYTVKGSVDTADKLPASPKTGDVYNIKAASDYGPAGMNVVWDGTAWDALGASITIDAMSAQEVTEAFNKAVGITS